MRGDLYHRLSVFPVQLPPLRDRRDDIGPLSDHLLRRVGVALGRPKLHLTHAARQALSAASWPGNVRELAYVLERSAILVDGNQIDEDDLALLPQTEARSPDAPTTITAISSGTRSTGRWRRRPATAGTRRPGWACRYGPFTTS